MQHLDAAGAIFARHGVKPYLDQVIAKKEILKASPPAALTAMTA